MIDLKLHPNLRIYYHPESDSYLIDDEARMLFNSNESADAAMCHAVEVEKVPEAVLRELLSEFVVPDSSETEDLFLSYRAFSTAARDLNCILQNPGMPLSPAEFRRWTETAMKVRQQLDQLIRRTATLIKNSK